MPKNFITISRCDPIRLLHLLLMLLAMGEMPLVRALAAASPERPSDNLFTHSNLLAWCIVPFDTKKRGPEARAQMLERLGITQLAYDWRAEHIPTFDQEVVAMKQHGVEMTAWWFPGALNSEAHAILDCIERNHIHPQLWVMMEGGPHLRWEQAFENTAAAQTAHVERMVAGLKPLAAEAAKLGCKIALYNHGGWFGVPENQIQIIERLKQDGVDNVGMVYTQHHGHGEIDRFAQVLPKMQPYLLALTLNGMIKDGDLRGHQTGTAPLGQGDQDLRLLGLIRNSGWKGPVGLILEVEADAELRLQDNLDGLDWLARQLARQPAGPKPTPRSWSPAQAALPTTPTPSFSGRIYPGKPEYRVRPLTVECRARLNAANNFNILVASDPKLSAEHWELYSYAGSGVFSLYLPGRGGEFKSAVNICDGRWHELAAVMESERIRLFVDGVMVQEARLGLTHGEIIPGGLAIGQLVEGGIGCDGTVEKVRLIRGIVPSREGAPSRPTDAAQVIQAWHFDIPPEPSSSSKDYWVVESSAAREQLPLHQTIPAATAAELTRANGYPKKETFLTWHRSHGDNGGSRYSALDQINRQNVTNLQIAWTYHSQDGSNFIQCNPIIANGVMFAPTAGKQVVAVNARTGAEIWRFKPEGKPAFRGLIYWPGGHGAAERVLFCAGKYLYALDPRTGQPITDFGTGGKTPLPGSVQGDFGAATAGPTLFERTIVVPGFEKDVWGLDLVTGHLQWTFHTVPQSGEFGYDTWDQTVSYGANCWAGMAMDEVRGIAYVTTGSAKDNFVGVGHLGDNLFANCIIALDARNGKRLWHFQEIRHDIWDLDMSAPPNLTTIVREGQRIDVVAAVTKLGNTILLDRVTGKPIFPFRLRRAPASDLPGEVTSPYQPDPELPEHFSRQEFTAADVTDRTEEATAFAQTRFQSATTGWFRPFSEGRANLFFNIDGGAEWTGACVDPESGKLYVSANHVGWIITVFRDDDPPDDPHAPKTRGQLLFETTCAACHGLNRLGIGTAPALRGLRHRLNDEAITRQVRQGKNGMPAFSETQLSQSNLQAIEDYLMLRDRPLPPTPPRPARPRYSYNGYPKFLDQEGYPANKPPWGTLNCINLNNGKLEWKVPLGEYPKLKAQGVPKTGTENYGGAIVTAGGLVFCAGTRDNCIRAFDKENGAELWCAQLPWTGNAPPATYQVDGRQYVVIAASGGNKLGTPYGDAYVAFALPPLHP